MKNNRVLIFCLSVILFFAEVTLAQQCNSGRYDTEFFSSVHITSNVVYGSNITSSGSTQVLKLDVYEPDGDSLAMRPLIVWVHGGSFVGGTKNDVDIVSLCNHFAKRGYVCASIEYRLGYSVFPPTMKAATETVFRAVQDMKAAVRFFRKDASTTNTYRIDPSIIFGGGSSAGAFAALHLAYLDEPAELPTEVDTTSIGGMEGDSGNPGYPSTINAVVDLCGALGNKTYIKPGDIPFCSMHGDHDGTVPYATATIYLLGVFPVMVVDGSYSISDYANMIGVQNEMYTYFGADHVPYVSNTAYMDTTVRFVSNFLYRYLGCNPSDPTPSANTFVTGINNVLAENNISVYPNPSTGKIWIDFNDQIEKIISVSINDLDGRKVFEKNDFENPVNVEGLFQGVYFLNLQTEKELIVQKVVLY